MILDFNNNAPEDIRATLFADIILPLPLPRLYTYRIPFELNELVSPGSRVVVQFGKKKIYTGIIAKLHDQPPKVYEAKLILDLMDDHPIVNSYQMQLFEWMADYYMCYLGEVIHAGLPSGLKLSSESRIQLNPHKELDEEDFNELELITINQLKTKGFLTYEELAQLINRKGVSKLIKQLIEKEAIMIYERIIDKYTPKTIKRVRIIKEQCSEKALERIFTELEKKPKQLDVLLKFLQLVPAITSPEDNYLGLPKSKLIETGISNSSLKTLIKNHVFEEFETIESRLTEHKESPIDFTFSIQQEAARDAILSQFESKDIVLFHGVTGSGKTEIFIDLIQKAIENGTQVLYLLPEIALTTQIVSRLKKAFGERMAVYHSRYSDNERVEVYKGVLNDDFPLIVGVRSSIFLPFSNLGMIIVDEEHDSSYKQYEPAPRYNARDCALMLGKIHHANVLLGSATPSVESYYHATSQRWGYVPLFERYGNAQLPKLNPIDIRYDHHAGSSFSKTLLSEIEIRLKAKEQIILFQNRRGYSPFIQCDDCEQIVMCPNCNVSLTYHMYTNEMRCHYCGHHQGVPTNCDACGSPKLNTKGTGTEKIEEALQIHFPEAVIQRMDLDTTRKKNSYQSIIDDFETGKIDLLVGTQMVTKGLDFDNVSLVGVFEIDRMLYFPDFRAQEKTFQMLTQVSGRAGRKEKVGSVIIQTSSSSNPTIQAVLNNESEKFYKTEINEREEFNYPPFSRIIKITVRHEDRNKGNQAATHLSMMLKTRLTETRVLGPEEPGINRVRNLFLTDILIKIERGTLPLEKVKTFIREKIEEIKTHKIHKKCLYTIDVDPS